MLVSFVLKSNFLEFHDKVKQQISGTAMFTKFAPPYACIYIYKTETDFLETQNLHSLIWLRHIANVFFYFNTLEKFIK